MILKIYSYFNGAGKYRGTLNLFEPEGDEKLHEDGVSIVRPVGGVFRQSNRPEKKWGHEGLTRVDGAYSGNHRLVNGKIEDIPKAERIRPVKPLYRATLDALIKKTGLTDAEIASEMK